MTALVLFLAGCATPAAVDPADDDSFPDLPDDDDSGPPDDDDSSPDDDDTGPDDDDATPPDDDDATPDDDDAVPPDDDDAAPNDDDATPPNDDDATLPDDDDDVTPDDDDATSPAPLPYPARDPMQIKGIQPDYWPNPDEISGNNTGGVAMNLVWAGWEPSVQAPPCAPASQQEYGGRCFEVDATVEAAIEDWTDRGLVVTAVVYGTPAWARTVAPCSPVASGFEIFCVADDPADYARFAGMLADRYDGLSGHGRIADFVIQNEVNSNDWYDIGCGQGTPCDTGAWLDRYAADWNGAYDAIVAEQPFARVLASTTHHFDLAFDQPSSTNPLLSVKTLLQGLDARTGGRPWRVAYHPYAPNLTSPEFSADDLPRVTYGNLGVLAGWLRATFPARPSAWEIHLTESGINSLSPNSSEAAQADAVCDSFRAVLGTPGIESYIYHRMRDHPTEVAAGLGLGLRRTDDTAKPAWATWAMANRADLTPPQVDCGFESLPHVRLKRGNLGARGHWITSRLLPPGFTEESQTGWRLYRTEQPGSTLLFECAVGAPGSSHSFPTPDPGCEGQQTMGPMGWILDAPGVDTVALYRCYSSSAGDHLVTSNANCEGWALESLLGYALVP